jgi:hypothetical protein
MQFRYRLFFSVGKIVQELPNVSITSPELNSCMIATESEFLSSIQRPYDTDNAISQYRAAHTVN